MALTTGFLSWLQANGVKTYPERTIPISWVNFRLHPAPFWHGVEMYRDMLRQGITPEPVVLCRECLVVLDGWHRMAAHWLEGKRYINVVLADQHWMNGIERCYVDKTNLIETIKARFDMDFVSGAYRESDWENMAFKKLANELNELCQEHGHGMPRMRFWEQIRAIAFLGWVGDKTILDVGTREAVVPLYLTKHGAGVTCLDLDTSSIIEAPGITIQQGDARRMPFADNTFDHATSTACLKHIPGWGDRQVVREMLRVVKPGGLVAISFDYGPTYEPYPSKVSGRRIYNEETALSRLGSLATIVGPEDWTVDWTADKDTWPIKGQASVIWDKDYNLQVAFMLLRNTK
jgi:SAM-dependent methyltransferase